MNIILDIQSIKMLNYEKKCSYEIFQFQTNTHPWSEISPKVRIYAIFLNRFMKLNLWIFWVHIQWKQFQWKCSVHCIQHKSHETQIKANEKKNFLCEETTTCAIWCTFCIFRMRFAFTHDVTVNSVSQLKN